MPSAMYPTAELVHRLVSDQFPQWARFPVSPVSLGGWDNRTFRLGDELLVRLPSDEAYAPAVEREQRWLPLVAGGLTQPVPELLGAGVPGCGFPWRWSVYRWLPGEQALADRIDDALGFATDIAEFLLSLHRMPVTGGPQPGPENFFRGGNLRTYDVEVRTSVGLLDGRINSSLALDAWESAVATSWHRGPVWVHGDYAPSNLLLNNGRLCGVIDFGQLAVGDPACDLAIAWTLLRGESRDVFREKLGLDAGTWKRGKAWALWKALIIAVGTSATNASGRVHCWDTIAEILTDHDRPEP